MNDQNLVNTQFREDQILWMKEIAKTNFHMNDRGALAHVIRTCVDLVREHGLLVCESDLAISNIPARVCFPVGGQKQAAKLTEG